MTLRTLVRILSCYALLLTLGSLVLSHALRLNRSHAPTGVAIVSVFRAGARVARKVVVGDATGALRAEGDEKGATRVQDDVLDSAAILAWNRLLFAASVAPGRDGVSVTYRGLRAYATPDDLLKWEAYESPLQLGPFSVVLGIDPEKVLGALAVELGTSAEDLFQHGKFERFAVRAGGGFPPALAAGAVSRTEVERGARGAARYLARVQHRDGSFRYEVNAATGADEPGYNWPRHAGAGYFLARAGNQLHDTRLFHAGRMAASFMRDHATLRCGGRACVGEGDQVDIGASALGLLLYLELCAGGASEFQGPALDLADFLRSQQLPNGDFQHLYSIAQKRPIDVQFEYYTGEAAFALSRAEALSKNPADLEAARRALTFLVVRPTLFLGAHYFWGAQHWTCQAMADLWARAPDRRALSFCLDWQAASRNYQMSAPPAPPEYDGALSRGPFVTPRLTHLASRLEAAVATLTVARAERMPAAELEPLESEIRRGFAFLLRYQFNPGPTYLMAEPRTVAGGVPGGPTDLHVRIDYPQHAGGAWLRYLELAGAIRG